MKTFLTSISFITLLLLNTLAYAVNNYANNGYAPPVIPPAFNHYQAATAYQHHPNVYNPDFFNQEQDPTQTIKDTLEKLTAFITHAGSVNPVELRAFIENEIIPQFDFDNMSHWITGPYAAYMTTEEKVDFQKQLRETFLSSLAKHLGSFDAENTRIRFSPAQYRGQAEAFVRTIVSRPGQRPMRLNFRMRKSGNSWKIIDIRANGASAVIYYRSHFMSQLRQHRKDQ